MWQFISLVSTIPLSVWWLIQKINLALNHILAKKVNTQKCLVLQLISGFRSHYIAAISIFPRCAHKGLDVANFCFFNLLFIVESLQRRWEHLSAGGMWGGVCVCVWGGGGVPSLHNGQILFAPSLCHNQLQAPVDSTLQSEKWSLSLSGAGCARFTFIFPCTNSKCRMCLSMAAHTVATNQMCCVLCLSFIRSCPWGPGVHNKNTSGRISKKIHTVLHRKKRYQFLNNIRWDRLKKESPTYIYIAETLIYLGGYKKSRTALSVGHHLWLTK